MSTPSSDADHGHGHHHGSMSALTLGALGVVYGDIGTSPLYAVRECFGEHGVAASQAGNVLGVLSLVFWSLVMVVTVKYLVFIMRADNQGEGGILALLALVPEKMRSSRGGRIGALAALVLIGAALLYGDGIITPAISVLSAIEGLKVAAPSLAPAVLPITCVVLLALFAIQSRGTGDIGRVFGPIMLVWFAVLGVLGIVEIAHNPSVLRAMSPVYAARFFSINHFKGFALLGSVVLAVTGGEALYADMGHFGLRPIRWAWLGLVLPGLLCSYFGQGALLLRRPEAAANLFFEMAPGGIFTYALVALATAATVIASQALISGVFSLTRQAVQLGYFPRVTVRHTSHEAEGQIYVPELNWALAIACIALVLGFQESSRLAAAYGIAVSGTMAITSIVYYVVVRRTWGWSVWKALPLVAVFLVFDTAFFGANLLKFWHGGYVPIFLGAAVFVAMMIWKRGRSLLGEHNAASSPSLDGFLAKLEGRLESRIDGTGVFMASSKVGVPPSLIHHTRLIPVLPERVILFTLAGDRVPVVPKSERVEVEEIGHGFFRVVARIGFMEQPDVPALLAEAAVKGNLPIEPGGVTYYLGRETFLATDKGRMGRYSESIFSFLSRNARSATQYFNIPPERVIEIGTQIDL